MHAYRPLEDYEAIAELDDLDELVMGIDMDDDD